MQGVSVKRGNPLEAYRSDGNNPAQIDTKLLSTTPPGEIVASQISI